MVDATVDARRAHARVFFSLGEDRYSRWEQLMVDGPGVLLQPYYIHTSNASIDLAIDGTSAPGIVYTQHARLSTQSNSPGDDDGGDVAAAM